MSLPNTLALHVMTAAVQRWDLVGQALPRSAPGPTQQPAPKATIPNPAPEAPPGLNEKMDLLVSWGKYGVLICGVAGLLICAGQMAIGRKNRSSFAADGATGIPWVLGGLSLAVTTASIVGVFSS